MQPITQVGLDPNRDDIRHWRAEQEFCGAMGCFIANPCKVEEK
jgi:hypothetical protein